MSERMIEQEKLEIHMPLNSITTPSKYNSGYSCVTSQIINTEMFKKLISSVPTGRRTWDRSKEEWDIASRLILWG